MRILILLLVTLLCHRALAKDDGYLDDNSMKLLKNVAESFPDFLQIPYEDVIRFMALHKSGELDFDDNEIDTPTSDIVDYTNTEKNEEKVPQENGDELFGNYIGMPDGSGKQMGQCDKVLANQPNMEWIQGPTNMTTGAMTLIYFMSTECTSCHEVAVKINNIYKKWRHRGLNVVALHSSPKGYPSTHDELTALQAFVKEEGIEYAIAELPAKDGEQPMLRSGLPDWKKAARIPTRLDSLYRYLFDEMEYVVPLAIIYKNCVPLMTDPLEGYHIMSLDRSIASSQDLMLWPYGQLYDDEVQRAGFEDAANDHGMTTEELELAWDGDVASEVGKPASDPYENLKKTAEKAFESQSEPKQRRGRKKKEKHLKGKSAQKEENIDEDDTPKKSKTRRGADPRDDDNAIIHGEGDTDPAASDNEGDKDNTDPFSVFDDDDDFDQSSRKSGAMRRKDRLKRKHQEKEEEEEQKEAPRRRGGLPRRGHSSMV
jgi:hypothetical protein